MKFVRTGLMLSIFLYSVAACKKSPVTPDSGGGGNNGGGGVVNPVDPPTENTIGFFLDDWTPKNFTAPSYDEVPPPAGSANVFVKIDASQIITKVPSAVFGHNANIWMTQMVTETPFINHVKNLQPNIIRFPGGSISDIYFWNAAPNQKPADAPSTLVNSSGVSVAAGYLYGKNIESWTASLDNYYAMLQQTGNQGMLTVNYGYARY